MSTSPSNIKELKKSKPPESITIVYESPFQGALNQDWFFDNLANWLNPDCKNVHFVQASKGPSEAYLVGSDSATYLKVIEQWQNQCQTKNEKLLKTLADKDLNVTLDIQTDLSNTSAEDILESLQVSKDTLLVLGSANGSEKELLKNSFAMNLATNAPCSALLLRNPIQGKPKPVVVLATDGSEASLTAARKLPDLIGHSNVDVKLVTIQDSGFLINPVISPYTNPAGIEEALKENAQMVLEMTADVLKAKGITVSEKVVFMGSPTWELLEAEKKLNADLMVVGTNNRKGFPRWLLGSISRHVLQASNSNVLVVRD